MQPRPHPDSAAALLISETARAMEPPDAIGTQWNSPRGMRRRGPRAVREALLAEGTAQVVGSEIMAKPSPSRALEALRSAVQVDIRRRTSSKSLRGTAALLAHSVTSKTLQDSLRACSRQSPCRLACCPFCSRRRGVRFYHDTLRKAGVDQTPTSQIRWVTVNVCETDDLAAGSALLARREHEALKHIVSTLRQRYCWLRDAEGNPQICDLRIWGAREVEPVYDDATGSYRWRWHWHLIVDLRGLPETYLADALRSRWPGARAVRIDKVRAKTRKGFIRSLKRMGSYPIKARFTYRRPDGMRQWLPPEVIDELARWMVTRGPRWSRFSLGNRGKVASTPESLACPRERSTVLGTRAHHSPVPQRTTGSPTYSQPSGSRECDPRKLPVHHFEGALQSPPSWCGCRRPLPAVHATTLATTAAWRRCFGVESRRDVLWTGPPPWP